MQISYHSTQTKIQKLQNLKKKKKFVPAGIARNWLVWPVHGRFLNWYETLMFRYQYTYQPVQPVLVRY